MFWRTSSLKRLNSFGRPKTDLAVFKRTQVQSFNSWFVIGGYHSIGKQYGGLSSLWAIRLYSLHVCLPYSRQVSKPTGLWQIQNYRFLFLCVTAKKCCTRCEISNQALYISLVCCFFEGGILPPK